MSKRISFISPVDHLSGNLSGTQDLVYPTKDNKAWLAPAGKQYARNYKPRFVGAIRRSDGLTYFSVRRKSAVNNTDLSRFAQACLGAASAIAVATIGTASIWATVGEQFLAEYAFRKAQGSTAAKSIRAFLTELFCAQLKDKDTYLTTYLQSSGGTILLGNPYNLTQFDAQRDPSLSDEMFLKFWDQLADNPIRFTVGQFKGVAHYEEVWQAYVLEDYNTVHAVVAGNYIKIGNQWIQYKDTADPESSFAYVTKDSSIEPDTSDYIYRLTSTAPV